MRRDPDCASARKKAVGQRNHLGDLFFLPELASSFCCLDNRESICCECVDRGRSHRSRTELRSLRRCLYQMFSLLLLYCGYLDKPLPLAMLSADCSIVACAPLETVSPLGKLAAFEVRAISFKSRSFGLLLLRARYEPSLSAYSSERLPVFSCPSVAGSLARSSKVCPAGCSSPSAIAPRASSAASFCPSISS